MVNAKLADGLYKLIKFACVHEGADGKLDLGVDVNLMDAVHFD